MLGMRDGVEGNSRAWAVLALMAVAEIMASSLWFTTSAASAQLQVRWALDNGQVGFLTTAVQIGFVAGTATAALLNLADIIPASRYFAACAILSAAANAALVVVPGYAPAVVLRLLTGVFLAGVYPPAMKMVSTWFRRNRGLAIATVVGALTIGKATPYLVGWLGGPDFRIVVLATSGAALLAGLIVAFGYREGPFPFERRPFTWALVGTVLRDRQTRLTTAGYLGHMWELYAMWTWVPAFLAASIARHGGRFPLPTEVVAFGAIAAGSLGSLWGGWAADRGGRERLVNQAMAASGACALVIGFLFGHNPWLVAALAWTWGFFVVADSAQFSALVTEVAPRHAVGTALTLQTSLGFLLTAVTIQAVPRLEHAVGWAWTFPILALGPAAGIAAIRRLQRVRAETGIAAATM